MIERQSVRLSFGFVGISYSLASIRTILSSIRYFTNLFIRLVGFFTMVQSPTLERASGLFDLWQSTMAAASAARTVLCGRFGFSETGLLASVGAGAPSVQTC